MDSALFFILSFLISIRVCHILIFFFFFLNDPAPPDIYPLPLPAALPIYLFHLRYSFGWELDRGRRLRLRRAPGRRSERSKLPPVRRWLLGLYRLRLAAHYGVGLPAV